jgi:hypothetical protein
MNIPGQTLRRKFFHPYLCQLPRWSYQRFVEAVCHPNCRQPSSSTPDRIGITSPMEEEGTIEEKVFENLKQFSVRNEAISIHIVHLKSN